MLPERATPVYLLAILMATILRGTILMGTIHTSLLLDT